MSYPISCVKFLGRNGIKAELRGVAMPFNSLIPSIQSDRIDLIGDAMYVRPARQQIIDFTEATFFNPEALDVAKGNPKGLHQLSDFCGLTAGSYQGTTYIDTLRQASAKCPAGKSIDIKQYPTIQNVLADLSAGRIDSAVVDASLSAYAAEAESGTLVRAGWRLPPGGQAELVVCLRCRKGQCWFLEGLQ